MKRILIVAIGGFLFATALMPNSTSAWNVESDDILSLTVRVRSRHDPFFEACVPVRVSEPFRIVWGSETVKGIVSGTVGAPVGSDYLTTLKISEGNGQCLTETGPKLKLDEPLEWSNVRSTLFKHIDTYRFVLSKKPCEVGDAPNNSGMKVEVKQRDLLSRRSRD